MNVYVCTIGIVLACSSESGKLYNSDQCICIQSLSWSDWAWFPEAQNDTKPEC
jgi:hypothetical protein